MVLTRHWEGTGWREKKEVGRREVGGEANDVSGAFGYQEVETGQPVRSCSAAACGARAAWQRVTKERI